MRLMKRIILLLAAIRDAELNQHQAIHKARERDAKDDAGKRYACCQQEQSFRMARAR
jgi:hypothetical protein